MKIFLLRNCNREINLLSPARDHICIVCLGNPQRNTLIYWQISYSHSNNLVFECKHIGKSFIKSHLFQFTVAFLFYFIFFKVKNQWSLSIDWTSFGFTQVFIIFTFNNIASWDIIININKNTLIKFVD